MINEVEQTEILESLIGKVESINEMVGVLYRQRRMVPVRDEIWDIADIAVYIKRSARMVLIYMSYPSFPKPVTMPSISDGTDVKKLYYAKEIIEWVRSHKIGEI